MSYYDEDFYYEPSEFDIQVAQFKVSLMKSVKEEFISKMDELIKENKELQEIKANFESIKRDFDSKKFELEREKTNLQYQVRRERLVDLFEDHKIIMYKAYSKKVRPEKCDKCDKFRRIEYITPLGRKSSEDCLCSEGKTVYYPHEYIRYEFRLNRNGNELIAWYRQYSDNEDGFVSDSSIVAEDVYSSEMKYEDLSSYKTFFQTKEECQAYCDYLNLKNGG